ncbi:hypothetical protein L3Q82_018376, partial [Scortum barcoo]
GVWTDAVRGLIRSQRSVVSNMMAAARAQVISLYRKMLSESRKFPSYNYRTYALRRVRDAFRANMKVEDPKTVARLLLEGEQTLALIQRQQIAVQPIDSPPSKSLPLIFLPYRCRHREDVRDAEDRGGGLKLLLRGGKQQEVTSEAGRDVITANNDYSPASCEGHCGRCCVFRLFIIQVVLTDDDDDDEDEDEQAGGYDVFQDALSCRSK